MEDVGFMASLQFLKNRSKEHFAYEEHEHEVCRVHDPVRGVYLECT